MKITTYFATSSTFLFLIILNASLSVEARLGFGKDGGDVPQVESSSLTNDATRNLIHQGCDPDILDICRENKIHCYGMFIQSFGTISEEQKQYCEDSVHDECIEHLCTNGTHGGGGGRRRRHRDLSDQEEGSNSSCTEENLVICRNSLINCYSIFAGLDGTLSPERKKYCEDNRKVCIERFCGALP